jgi:hypothetical protein
MSRQCPQRETHDPVARDARRDSYGKKRVMSRKFHFNWVMGSALFFLVVYAAGTFFGSTLIDVAVTPTDKEIVSVANEKGAGAESIVDLSPKQRAAAKATAVDRTKSSMSEGTAHLIYWFLTIILIFFCGGIVGFVSNGRTILEVGIGAALGLLTGYGVERFALDRDVGTTAIGIIVAIGVSVALLGAWIGEVLQGNEERSA